MIRFTTFCGLALALAAPVAAQDKKDVPKELAAFQGTWKVVNADFNGKAPLGSNLPELRLTFSSDRMRVTDGAQVETGSFAVNARKNPGQLNLVNSAGTRIQGIYKFEKDGTLSLCLVKERGQRPKSFDTKNTNTGLMVLERVKE